MASESEGGPGGAGTRLGALAPGLRWFTVMVTGQRHPTRSSNICPALLFTGLYRKTHTTGLKAESTTPASMWYSNSSRATLLSSFISHTARYVRETQISGGNLLICPSLVYSCLLVRDMAGSDQSGDTHSKSSQG
jgi:hypothetical protein